MAKKTKLREGQRLGNPRTTKELHERLTFLKCVLDPNTGSGHIKVIFPEPLSGSVQIAKTPSQPSNLLDIVSRLRRYGVDVRAMKVTAVGG